MDERIEEEANNKKLLICLGPVSFNTFKDHRHRIKESHTPFLVYNLSRYLEHLCKEK